MCPIIGSHVDHTEHFDLEPKDLGSSFSGSGEGLHQVSPDFDSIHFSGYPCRQWSLNIGTEDRRKVAFRQHFGGLLWQERLAKFYHNWTLICFRKTLWLIQLSLVCGANLIIMAG